MSILALQIFVTTGIAFIATTIFVRSTQPIWTMRASRLHNSLLVLLFIETMVMLCAALVFIWTIPSILTICS